MATGDPQVWMERSRRGHEASASTSGWGEFAACKNDARFIDRNLSAPVVEELISICNQCPVRARCLAWAEAQTQPVGFVVAGGKRWKAWNHCAICGKRVRGVDRCPAHSIAGDPVGTIDADGNGREHRFTDDR